MVLTVILLLVTAAVFAAIIIHARVVFVLRIDGGRITTLRGRPPPGFVNACEDVARMRGVAQGRIKGVRTGAGTQLRFSSEIPAHTHQAFRNVWTPPPGGGGGGGARASG
ncbi:hypothetical protein J2T57_002369 [Natronocella acetinitrilica]|uniref:DUF3634 family protein n=1 Tax=Natronocella acetinitrilica TaxID=414046 RepID=A0AAE3G5R0_9GAMM|nr:DUF3634 family protein [Natronocella acetinitrilica]MCP1675221.1 hypothetical protein [Natronocella acetinitrilica]